MDQPATPDVSAAVARVKAFVTAYVAHPSRSREVYGIEDSNGSHPLTTDDLTLLTDVLDTLAVTPEYVVVWGDDGSVSVPFDWDHARRKASTSHGDVIQRRFKVAAVSSWEPIPHEPDDDVHVPLCDTPGPGHDCAACQS